MPVTPPTPVVTSIPLDIRPRETDVPQSSTPDSAPEVFPTTSPEDENSTTAPLGASEATRFVDREDMIISVAMVGALVGSFVVMSPSSAGTLVRIALLMNEMECRAPQYVGDRLGWALHPLGFPIGDHENRYYYGAVVWNMSAIFAIFLVFSVFTMLRSNTTIRAYAVVPVYFLLPPTVLCGLRLAVFADLAPTRVCILGLGAATFCMILPLLINRRVFHTKVFKADFSKDPEASKSKIYKFFFGSEMWTSRFFGRLFLAKNRAYFELYHDTMRKFVLADVSASLLLAAILSWHPVGPSDECIARNTVATGVLCLFCIATLLARPYIAAYDNLFAGLVSTILASTAVVGTMEMSGSQSWVSGLPKGLLIGAALLAIIKSLCDVVLLFKGSRRGRRKRGDDCDADEDDNCDGLVCCDTAINAEEMQELGASLSFNSPTPAPYHAHETDSEDDLSTDADAAYVAAREDMRRVTCLLKTVISKEGVDTAFAASVSSGDPMCTPTPLGSNRQNRVSLLTDAVPTRNSSGLSEALLPQARSGGEMGSPASPASPSGSLMSASLGLPLPVLGSRFGAVGAVGVGGTLPPRDRGTLQSIMEGTPATPRLQLSHDAFHTALL